MSGVTPTGAASTARVTRASRSPRSDQPAGGGHDGRAAAGPATTGAVLLATVPATNGEPAAALRWGEVTLLRRLLDQLADLGVREAHVVTRPAWESTLRRSIVELDMPVELHVSADTPQDLRTVAALARAARGGLVVAQGDVVTQREALAGLLADPRVATGILTSSRRVIGRPFTPRTRSIRGRVISAASPYHAVHAPNAKFLGVLKVAPGHRATLAEVAEQLALLTTAPLPASWEE